MFWPPQRSLPTHCHKLNKVKAWEGTYGIGKHLSCYKQRRSCLFYLITREFGKSNPVQSHRVLGEMPCAEGVLQPAMTRKLRVLLPALCLSWTELLFVIFTLQNTVLGILVRLKLEKRQKVSKECVTEGQKEQALIVFSLSAICAICTHLYFSRWYGDAAKNNELFS